jgi:hypothetical protein
VFKTRRCPSKSCPSISFTSQHFSTHTTKPSIIPEQLQSITMGYPDTTDAFAITDIKNWSTFTRKEVRRIVRRRANNTDHFPASPQEVRGVRC